MTTFDFDSVWSEEDQRAEIADPAPSLRAVPVDDFAAVDEASAEPLLGDAENTILSAGGTLVFYGKGGASKTTLEVDLLVHVAAGTAWLGLPVPRRCRVLLIENEGPRGKLRQKLRAKLAAWSGPDLDGHLLVLEEPWGRFSFAAEAHRDELVALVREHEVDVLAAGPVGRLGIAGGGTPDEVAAFVGLIEEVRARVERPLAAVLVHHDNKAGTVSGAWEGVPDTLVHVQASGNGATRVTWDKVRWGSTLHGIVWKLLWRPGEAFERDEAPEVTDDEIREAILAVVGANPGCSWNMVETEAAVSGKTDRKREARDALLEEGKLVNLGGGKGGTGGGGMRLHLPGDVPEQEAFAPGGANGGANASPPTGAPGIGTVRPSPPRKGGEGGANGSRGAPDARSDRCANCGKRLERGGPGEPLCRCSDRPDPGEDDIERWESIAKGGAG